jgi:DNA-binding MarR family transcriptional regulator
MARVHNRAVSRFDLSAVQANILAVLWIEGPLTIGELQSALALGSSTLTGAIDRMERAGLVARQSVVGDRRAFRLVPAVWPEKRKAALLDTLIETETRFFAPLAATERRQLAKLLGKLLDSIGEAEDDDD